VAATEVTDKRELLVGGDSWEPQRPQYTWYGEAGSVDLGMQDGYLMLLSVWAT